MTLIGEPAGVRLRESAGAKGFNPCSSVVDRFIVERRPKKLHPNPSG
jgi:hypothetical protein